ncbi:hypothetical protein ACFLZ7_01245 [Nanoarchaeota archaeon]
MHEKTLTIMICLMFILSIMPQAFSLPIEGPEIRSKTIEEQTELDGTFVGDISSGSSTYTTMINAPYGLSSATTMGITESCSDYSNTLGSCSIEGQWGYTDGGLRLWQCNDMIVFGKLLCWELESEEGDSDFCKVLKAETDFICGYEAGDCDWDSECSSKYECVGGPGTIEGCCYSGEEYDGDDCYETCDSGYLNEYRCSGDSRQRKYQYSDCDTTWKTLETCDDVSTTSWSSNYCSGDNIKRKRTVYTEYCSPSSCGESSSTQYDIVSQEGDGDYCDKALDAGCACTEGEGDCDIIGGDECASGHYCDVAWLGTTDYCCPYGKEWDGNSCETPCYSHTSYSCSSGHVYWYDSCGNREEVKTNCGTSEYVGSNYCSGDDVYRNYETKGCSGSGCTSSTAPIVQQDCGIDSCDAWGPTYCKNGAKYQSRTCYTRGCSSGGCYENPYTEEQLVETCGTGICSAGSCVVECTSGACCDNGIFADSSVVCDTQAQYGCTLQGNVETRTREQRCSGTTNTCAGASTYTDWTESAYCGFGEECIIGQSSCNSLNYECYSNSDCNSNEVCNSQGQCNSIPVSNTFSVSLEDAPAGTIVYKQPGDYVNVVITASGSGTVHLDRPSSWPIVKGQVSNDQASVQSGLNIIQFIIPENAARMSYKFEIDNRNEYVQVIDNPALILVTDRVGLYERYNYDHNVKDVLEEAFILAESENGVVYFIDDYIVGRPWSSFSSYSETPIAPQTDNDYVIKSSEIIRNKCHETCNDVLIIGDDFVVPHYRRNIEQYHGTNFLWWEKYSATESIYSDLPYIPRTKKPFSELRDLFVGKDVAMVIPSLSGEMQDAVNDLKNTIESKYGTVEMIDESDVGCNSFNDLEDKTLILIGTEKTNNAMACLPFVSDEISSMSLERNVWSDLDYSIVLNSDEDIYDNILALKKIVEDGPQADWTFGDAVVACLWDGKFEGAPHPVSAEITCNMIPLVELAPDLRDSWKCMWSWGVGDTDTDAGVADFFICKVVDFATAYDLATWGAAFITAGAAGFGGEVFDGSIAMLKVGLKNFLPNIVTTLGRKVVKEAVETIVAAPKLIGGLVKLVARSPKLLAQMVEGGIHILKHGPEVAESSFSAVKNLNFDFSADALKGAGNVEELRITKRYRIFDNNVYGGLNPKKVYEYFGEDTVIKNIDISRKGFEEEFKNVKISFGELDETADKLMYGVYIPAKQEIILNVKHIDVARDRLKDFTIIHEHAHALEDGIVFSERFIARMTRLNIQKLDSEKYLKNFFEFDANARMYHIMDPSEAAKYRDNIGKHVYDEIFDGEIIRRVSAGHSEVDFIAKSLAETEKFGFSAKNNMILSLIDNTAPGLKSEIIALKNIMLQKAGTLTSQNYDDALLTVLNEVKKIKG